MQRNYCQQNNLYNRTILNIMKNILAVIASVLSAIVLTGCSKKQYVDYRIESVSMQKVLLNSVGDRKKVMPSNRDYYLMQVGVTPVHKKSAGMSVRPYPEGCVDRISDIVVESADHKGQNDKFIALEMPDGRCKDVMMQEDGGLPKLIGYYGDLADVKNALQTGDDPRFIYLLSVPQGKVGLQSITIKTSGRTISGAVQNQPVSQKVTDVQVDITSRLARDPSDMVNNAYKDICANPRSQLYSDATEKYCTPQFKSALKKTLDAVPEGEVGPIEFDYWLWTQDDTGVSYRIKDAAIKSSGVAEVKVTLLQENVEYNTVTVVVKNIDGNWLIDDFYTVKDGKKYSIKEILR